MLDKLPRKYGQDDQQKIGSNINKYRKNCSTCFKNRRSVAIKAKMPPVSCLVFQTLSYIVILIEISGLIAITVFDEQHKIGFAS